MSVQEFKKVHFIGIGGIGMSAIAEILLARGYEVSGSDQADSERLEKMRKKGAKIAISQNPENIASDVDIVVRSTAIRETNPEFIETKRRGLPLWHRSEMLAYLMNNKKAICVAGSHGKTTTSSMIALMFEDTGLEPTIIVGGVINELGTNAKYGKGDWLVAEADESDGSLINFFPWVSIVTNIEEDHLDHYKDLNAIKLVFETFVGKTNPNGLTFLCTECKEAMALKALSPAKTYTYGFSEDADYGIKNHVQHHGENSADIYKHGKYLGRLSLSIPGVHNILNATVAIALGDMVGLPFEAMSKALGRFHGTKRRFQLVGEINGVKIIDDYAHHPTEIKATLQAARASHEGRVLAIFQPHRYTRTKFLAKDFAKALENADEVFLMSVYPAGEDPIEGVSSALIGEYLKETKVTLLGEDMTEVIAKNLQSGDMAIFMGAGNIWKEGTKLEAHLKMNK